MLVHCVQSRLLRTGCVAIGFEPEIVPSSADHHQTLTLELKLSSQQIDFYSVAVLLLLCGILLVLCYCVAHVCKLWQEVVAQYKDSMHVPARHARQQSATVNLLAKNQRCGETSMAAAIGSQAAARARCFVALAVGVLGKAGLICVVC